MQLGVKNVISEKEIVQIVNLYIEGKKDVLLAIGIISPFGEKKMCIGKNDNGRTYEIGSITKSFVASLIADLVEQKRVSILELAWKDISLKQLLTHGSGIEEYPIPTGDYPNPFSGISIEEVNRFAESMDIVSNPEWAYSNLGFALIGMFLEEKLNRPFSEILEDYIQNTLKLHNTRIGYNGSDLLGHSTDAVAKWCWNKQSAFLPAGCLISDLDDMMAYLKLHMTKASYAICHETHFETDVPFDMGLAFMKQKEDGITFISGLTPGFSSVICFDSAKQYGVVVLSNYSGYGYGNPNTPMGIGFSILNALSGNSV